MKKHPKTWRLQQHLLAHHSGGRQFGLGSAGKFFCWICPGLLAWCSQLEDFLRPGGPWQCHMHIWPRRSSTGVTSHMSPVSSKLASAASHGDCSKKKQKRASLNVQALSKPLLTSGCIMSHGYNPDSRPGKIHSTSLVKTAAKYFSHSFFHSTTGALLSGKIYALTTPYPVSS